MEKEDENVSETNSLRKKKKKREGNWSMPLHELPLIMVFKGTG